MNYELPQMKFPEQKGLVSIIIPIYNNENFLRECLDSVLAQTFSNWEVILVNDGSTDGTEKIIDEYVKKDSRFVAIHKQNEGTLLARKAGLENSKGEFIANIDHDDIYHSQFLEKMYAKIIGTNADFVWCKCQVTDEKNTCYYVTDYEWDTDVSKNIAMMITPSQGMSWLTWDKLIKREIYAKVCFPKISLITGEDPVQMLQVAYHSKSAAFVPENLYFHKFAGITSVSNPISEVKATVAINEILEYLFNGTIPCDVKKSFYDRRSPFTAYSYFLLNKKERQTFKDKLGPILPEFIKREKRINLKICLFLANKGIEFPFRLREILRMKIYIPIKKLLKLKKENIGEKMYD